MAYGTEVGTTPRRTTLPPGGVRYLIRKWQALAPSVFFRRSLFYSYFYVAYSFLRMIQRKRWSVCVFPVHPVRPHGIWKCLRLTGTRATMDPDERSDVALAHVDATTVDPDVIATFEGRLNPRSFVINAGCTSVAKDKVEKVFEQVFGRPLHVDPTTHVGPAVRKSKKNAVHDGEIVECPLSADDCDDDFAYEIVIDNELDDRYHQDLRVVVVGDELPCVFLMFRPREHRFAQEPAHRAHLADADTMFSSNEQEAILRLARAMGVDFAVLDVLRSNSTGQIYVVDVNHTPHLPPYAAESIQGIWAMHRMAKAFERQFLQRRYSRMSET